MLGKEHMANDKQTTMKQGGEKRKWAAFSTQRVIKLAEFKGRCPFCRILVLTYKGGWRTYGTPHYYCHRCAREWHLGGENDGIFRENHSWDKNGNSKYNGNYS